MDNRLLYVVTVLIWGSTWLPVKWHADSSVAPEVSIVYRFALAAAIQLIFVRLRGLTLRFDWRQHLFIALQGVFLFSINYYLVYVGSGYIVSGLVAITFSTVVIFNSLLAALILGNPIRSRVIIGAVLGMLGLALVYYHQLQSFSLTDETMLGLIISLSGAACASLGNVMSARNQRAGLPVVQTNALGMAYGTLLMLGLVIVLGSPLTIDTSLKYLGGMAFLAVFGSVVAFWTYLTLLGNIGPDRAAYVSILFPIIALLLSTLFEGFRWDLLALLGVALVVGGNVVAVTRSRAQPAPQPEAV